MRPSTYDEIADRLDEMEPAQLERLMGELSARMAQRPKRRLEDFSVVPDEAKGTGEDWVGALRAEWDDRG